MKQELEFRGRPEHLPIRGEAKMGGFTVQILLFQSTPKGVLTAQDLGGLPV